MAGRLLILGAGGHGRAVAELAAECGWSVAGFTDNSPGPGVLGGDDAAACLLGVLEHADGTRWAKAARALARTGDARGVRYFSRTRIVDTDPGRRRLAEELYETASARRAEIDREAKKRSSG